jgi:hypothetical protein
VSPDTAALLALPALPELLRCSGSAQVAAINVSRYRSDALLLAAGTITCVPLPWLSPAGMASKITLLDAVLTRASTGAVISEPSGPNSDLSGILEWLWDTIACPVLDQLGYADPAREPASVDRIWWMPTGALCRLPLHAAGYHREGGGRTVLDRVVSSYTATVRALGRGRDRAGAAEPAAGLLVASSEQAVSEHATRASQETTRFRPILADSAEPLHLTSALQFSGFGQVVGALWELGDPAAFYRQVATGAGSSPARAVHAAVRGLRDDGCAGLPLAWAGYVHAGA